MNDDETGIPDSLRARFPNLRPVKKAPALVRINGIGMGMYGKRDFDQESGTYIKTHCVCLLFVPILAIGAYRVADAEKGWYFIGKEPLSSFAKSCNFGALLLTLLFAGIMTDHAIKSSPEYAARQELRHAEQALRSGKALEAARRYRDAAQYTPSKRQAAQAGLRKAFAQCLTNDSPDEVAAAFRLLATLPASLNSPYPIVSDASERGLALVEKFRAANPDGALDVLHEVAALPGTTNAALRPLQIDLLKAAIAAKADNTNCVVELAVIYEEEDQLDLSYQLLTPYAAKLGDTEGARILGRHLLEEGKYEDAYGLLYPYVQARLEKLRTVERSYTNTTATLYKRSIQQLQDGQADSSFYDAYKVASKSEKEVLVEGYVRKQMENDPAFKRVMAELLSANKIVHVALDLGMVQLNRAQTLTDPAARKAELEAAEKTFLATQGLAGDTDQYRLFLGQVYYWLGKSKEGGELFDELLASHKRAYPILIELARTFRQVGDESQARTLCEEAYSTGKAGEEKFAAAHLRSRLPKDIDDEIAWLEKADPAEAAIQIELNNSRGRKALKDGNREQAATYWRKAIAGYQSVPESYTMLNNCGLVYLDLYLATGDIADHNKGLELLEKAIALAPGNSVLLMNVASLFVTRAYMDVVGDAIHFAALRETPGRAMLGHLYKDEAGRAALNRQLQQNEHMKKGLACLDKALLLAPKNPSLYGLAVHLQQTFGDLAELQKLQKRLEVAAPDLGEVTRETREAYDGTKDKERLDHVQNEARRYQALLSAPQVKDHLATLGFAEVELNGLEQGAGLAGGTVDSEAVLARAIANRQRFPNSASLNGLAAAYFYRAHEQLKAQNAGYASLAESTRRAVAPRDLMALLVDRNDALAAAIRQNPNFRKGAELLQEHGRLFPQFRQPEEWVLFRGVDAGEAARVVEAVNENQAARLAEELRLQLNPLAASVLLNQYWVARMNGQSSKAAALYNQALRDGVPLPPAL